MKKYLVVALMALVFVLSAATAAYADYRHVDIYSNGQTICCTIRYTTSASSYYVYEVDWYHKNGGNLIASSTYDVYDDYAWWKRDTGEAWRGTGPWLWLSQARSGIWHPNKTLSRAGNDQFVITIWQYPGGALNAVKSYFYALP